MEQLSVVILTLNEAPRIRRCLDSIQIPANVVVWDSFSTDRTIEEAQRAWRESGRPASKLAGIARQWRGFTEARNASLAWVQTEWVLWLDADEWLSPELNREIAELLTRPEAPSLWRLPRQSFFLGRAIRFGGWYPDFKRRLVRSGKARWKSGPLGADVHEDLALVVGENIGTMRSPILHESFRDLQEQFETNDRYSTLLARGLADKWISQKKRAPGRLWIAMKVGVKLIENYIFKRGFLDGRPGWLIARGSALSLKMRLEKARNLLEEKSK